MSLSSLCLSLFSFSATHSPPSPSLCHRSLCFKGGKSPYSYTRHTIPTNHHSCPTAWLSPPLPQTSAPFDNERSSAAWHCSPTAAERKNEGFFYEWMRDDLNRGRTFRGGSGISGMSSSFLLPLSSPSFISHLFFILAFLFFVYFRLVFPSTLTCSLCFYYLALVDHRTENLAMRTAWCGHTHTHTHPTEPHISECWHTHIYTGFQILYTWTHHIHIHTPDISDAH